MKRMFAITLILALLLALVSMPLSAQDRWDGADDLDVNPLACGMGDEMMGRGRRHGRRHGRKTWR